MRYGAYFQTKREKLQTLMLNVDKRLGNRPNDPLIQTKTFCKDVENEEKVNLENDGTMYKGFAKIKLRKRKNEKVKREKA